MTGEMHASEVTREDYPLHFMAADQVDGATVEPFDQYQGPFIHVPGKGRFWLTTELDRCYRWWSESADEQSGPFLCDPYMVEEDDEDEPDGVSAFLDLIENGGDPVERE